MKLLKWFVTGNINYWRLSAILLAIVILTSCTSNPQREAKSLLETLEFGPDEYGFFKIVGDIDLNPFPLFSTTIHIELEKIKDAPE